MGARLDYATRPRELIAEMLRGEHRFLTAAEIHSRLDAAGAKVSLSTVYRTLDHLQAKGEASARVDTQGEAAFTHCEPQRHHHHAICRRCGKVEDVTCAAAETFADALREQHGFQLDDHAMEFFGTCRTCR